MTKRYPDNEMQVLVELMSTNPEDALKATDVALAAYNDDPRLHFLKGSMVASLGKSIEAYHAFKMAVELEPDFWIARFQLGFFQLTSGESENALKTWARLDMLPQEHYLKLFSVGLRHLVRDEFAQCIAHLESGIQANTENLPLNKDMALIIERTKPLLHDNAEQTDIDEEESITSLLLSQNRTIN